MPQEQKPPRFGTLLGIGGVVAYLLGFIPAMFGVLAIAGAQFAEQSADNPELLFQDVLNDLATNTWVIVGVLASQSVVFLTYAFIVSVAKGSKNFFKDYGLKFKWYSPLFIFVGIGLQVLGVIVGIPFILLRDTEPPQQEIVRSVSESRGLSFFVFALFVALLVPIVEEICFRGLLQRSLMRTFSPLIAVLVSSILFAAVHLMDPNVILAMTQLLLVGLVCGILSAYTGRIDTAIFTHIGFNLTTVLIIMVA